MTTATVKAIYTTVIVPHAVPYVKSLSKRRSISICRYAGRKAVWPNHALYCLCPTGLLLPLFQSWFILLLGTGLVKSQEITQYAKKIATGPIVSPKYLRAVQEGEIDQPTNDARMNFRNSYTHLFSVQGFSIPL